MKGEEKFKLVNQVNSRYDVLTSCHKALLFALNSDLSTSEHQSIEHGLFIAENEFKKALDELISII